MPDFTTSGHGRRSNQVHRKSVVAFEDDPHAADAGGHGPVSPDGLALARRGSSASMTLEDMTAAQMQRLQAMGREVAAGRALSGKGSVRSAGARWPVGHVSSMSAGGRASLSRRKSKMGPTGRPRPRRLVKVKQIAKIDKGAMFLQKVIEQNYGALRADRYVTRRNLNVNFAKAATSDGQKGEEEDGAAEEEEIKYKICPTVHMNPVLPKDIDTSFSAVHFEVMVKFPSTVYSPPIQLWEPFVVTAVLLLVHFDFTGRETEEEALKMMRTSKMKEVDADGQPLPLTWHERHVERVLTHTERSMKRILPGAVIRQHMEHPCAKNKDTRFYAFLDDFLRKKFEPYQFGVAPLQEYVKAMLFEPFASKDQRTPRCFCVSPWVVQMLTSAPDTIFEGQYEELLQCALAVGLPIFDVVATVRRKRAALSKNVWSAAFDRPPPGLDWQNVQLYLDTMLISKRYGGFCIKKEAKVPTSLEEMCIKKLGATIEDIIAGRNIVAIVDKDKAKKRRRRRNQEAEHDVEVISNHSHRSFFSDHSLVPEEERSASKRRPSALLRGHAVVDHEKEAREEEAKKIRQREIDEWERLLAGLVDPEDARFQPLGMSLTEMFLLIQGMVLAMDWAPDADGDGSTDIDEGHQRILRTRVAVSCRDRHVLAAAVLIDLYMREKIDIWAWELQGESSLQDVTVKGDVWTGPVSSVYRVLPAEGAPLWTNQAPPSPGAPPGSRGEWHWMESFVPRADDIFQKMALPPLLEESIWLNMLWRGCLEMCDEDVSRWGVTGRAKRCCQFLFSCAECWCPCFVALGRCLRRRAARFRQWLCPRRGKRYNARRMSRRRSRMANAVATAAASGGEADGGGSAGCLGCCRSDPEEKLLEMYEFCPAELPVFVNNGVTAWFMDLERRRLRCRGEGTVTPSEAGTQRTSDDAASVAASSIELPAPGADEPGSPPSGRQDSIAEAAGSVASGQQPQKGSSVVEGSSMQSGKKSKASKASKAFKTTATTTQEGPSRAGAQERSKGEAVMIEVEEASESSAESSSDAASGARERETASSAPSSGEQDFVEEDRKVWWERVKAMYCDAYYLMFEDGVLYFEAEQEAALWRAQLLMFFFALQSLFEVAWEGHNGFERMMQALCPPFAKLPLKPPRGMEHTGALIRGLCQRARALGEAHVTQADAQARIAVEAGIFHERVRQQFMDELFECPDIFEAFNADGDDELTLDEFIEGIRKSSTRKNMRMGGMPLDVVDGLIVELAAELFDQMDDDGNGVLTQQEVREAVRLRQQAAEERRQVAKESAVNRILREQFEDLERLMPGTTAYNRQRKLDRDRDRRLREEYERFEEARKKNDERQKQREFDRAFSQQLVLDGSI